MNGLVAGFDCVVGNYQKDQPCPVKAGSNCCGQTLHTSNTLLELSMVTVTQSVALFVECSDEINAFAYKHKGSVWLAWSAPFEDRVLD